MNKALNFNRPLVDSSIRAVAVLARDPHALIRIDARKGEKLHASATSSASNPTPLVDFAHGFDGVEGVNLHVHLGDVMPNLPGTAEVKPTDYRSIFGVNVSGSTWYSPAKLGAFPILLLEDADGQNVIWDMGAARPSTVIDQIQNGLDQEAGRLIGAKASPVMRIPGTWHLALSVGMVQSWNQKRAGANSSARRGITGSGAGARGCRLTIS